MNFYPILINICLILNKKPTWAVSSTFQTLSFLDFIFPLFNSTLFSNFLFSFFFFHWDCNLLSHYPHLCSHSQLNIGKLPYISGLLIHLFSTMTLSFPLQAHLILIHKTFLLMNKVRTLSVNKRLYLASEKQSEKK